MVRRSTPQKKTDHAAYPVQLRFKVPERGFGNMLQDIHDWLDAELGLHNATSHPNGLWGTTYYFRSVAHAFRFVQAFPSLELDDRTTCSTFTAPGVAGGLPPL